MQNASSAVGARLTIHSSRTRFAGRLNSGVRLARYIAEGKVMDLEDENEDDGPSFEELIAQAQQRLNLSPGDIYEDCSYHPVLCVFIDYDHDSIEEISLIDGSYPRSCSLLSCGVRKLTVEEAWRIKKSGPDDIEANKNIKALDHQIFVHCHQRFETGEELR